MRNTYILMIVQALLTLLLFFSESYLLYATVFLFVVFDILLFIDVLTKDFSSDEALTLGAILCSGIFLLFYVFARSTITTVFGIFLMLLFLIIAMLSFMSNVQVTGRTDNLRHTDRLMKPEEPPYYYDVEFDSAQKSVQKGTPSQPMYTTQPIKSQPIKSIQPVKTSQPVNVTQPITQPIKHSVQSSSKDIEGLNRDDRDRIYSRAVAYELEREAAQLKEAEKAIRKLDTYNVEDELIRETQSMEQAQKLIDRANKANALKELQKEAAEISNVQKQINEINKLQKVKSQTKELSREARALKKAEKQINEINKVQKIKSQSKELQREAAAMKKAEKQINEINKVQKIKSQSKELQREAAAMKKAEKQIEELKFLDQQEKIVKQARDIAKAQKDIDALKKKKPAVNKLAKSAKKASKIKTVKVQEESFYFVTEKGNKFHEPGCLSIKNVPKNKLILYTNKKDAMKKGYKPCPVCIPK